MQESGKDPQHSAWAGLQRLQHVTTEHCREREQHPHCKSHADCQVLTLSVWDSQAKLARPATLHAQQHLPTTCIPTSAEPTHTLASSRKPNRTHASGLHTRSHATRKTLPARINRLAQHPTAATPFGQRWWGLQSASGVSKREAGDSTADYCYQCQNQLAGWEKRDTHKNTHAHTHAVNTAGV
jgi:hypothetical protein